MNITYEFIGYVGSVFTNEKGERVEFKAIENNFYKLNGKKGKIFHKGYTSVIEHGYSGGYDSYGFVCQDNLKPEKLEGKMLLEYCA